MELRLDGKRAFVSAGAVGIGRATCLALRTAGATVFTADIDQEALAQLPADIHCFHCDVGEPSAVAAVMQQVLIEGLDILINNAGIAGPTAPIEAIAIADWVHTINVCLNSQFYFSRQAVPVFKRQRHGVLINLISAAGVLGFPNRSPYAAAKWGAVGLTKTLAMELGRYNIRVNGIVPGNVNGERMQQVVAAHAAAENLSHATVRELYAISTSMRCFVEASEIAHLIVFLASHYGQHISGQIIGVDGNTETLCPRMPE